jgi:hypothetical protein
MIIFSFNKLFTLINLLFFFLLKMQFKRVGQPSIKELLCREGAGKRVELHRPLPDPDAGREIRARCNAYTG